MNTKALERTARRLSEKPQPRPRLIHCAAEVADMLETLRWQIIAEGGDPDAPVEWTEEQEEWARQLSDLLGEQVSEIERCCNVRFVD